jgi:hypothetical protein
MIENNDEKGLSDLQDPKAYWTLVKDPVTNATVSTMAARMKKGSICEGSVPQYMGTGLRSGLNRLDSALRALQPPLKRLIRGPRPFAEFPRRGSGISRRRR